MTVHPSDQRKFLGHPIGLFVLFFTEMWERFSYYGMRALLVLYMTKYLFIEAEKGREIFGYQTMKSFVSWFAHLTGITDTLTPQIFSSQIYGFYTGFVYLTPLFGGMLADRLWGQRKTVYVGAILMAIGHFMMAFESQFFLALVFLIAGNGCFKPNICTQVGSLYDDGSPGRDGAFTIFYMGINLGAFLSPLICGMLGQRVGWHYGFGAAGIGMVLGLLVYHLGRGYLPPDYRQAQRLLKEARPDQPAPSALTSEEWKRIFVLIFLGAVNVCFWAVYEQQGNALQLWADQYTNFTVFGWEMPSTWMQSFNAFFIFLFAPLVDIFWTWQSRRGKEPNSVLKMGIGCVILGLGFALMVAAAKGVGPGAAKSSLMWIVASTWLFTMGELYLSPIGLSLVTKVAPVRMVSMMMGMWYLSMFFGNTLSGQLGSYYEILPKDVFFGIMTGLAIVTGGVFFLINRPLRKVLDGVDSRC